MKIKNKVLAAMLSKMGVEVKAELVIDDANGTTLTFPDISDINELAIGVATDAADGTYVIADGDNSITIVVLSGLIESIEVVEPSVDAEVEPDAEVLAVLEAVVAANVEQKSQIVALQNELKALKVSLKHEDGKAPAAAAGKAQPKFKVVG